MRDRAVVVDYEALALAFLSASFLKSMLLVFPCPSGCAYAISRCHHGKKSRSRTSLPNRVT